jgi:hypothetical protein
MPPDLMYTYGTLGLIVGTIILTMARRRFDAFSPIWLFLAGYAQVYVIQAISYRDYALRARGQDLVTAASFRAFWAIALFLGFYHCGLAKWVARRLPSAPTRWSPGLVVGLSPIMVLWGLACAGLVLRSVESSQEENLWRAFPILMLIAGVMLMVTGRRMDEPRPALAATGLAIVVAYVLIWMFNGRRSHAVIGVLTGVCGWYVPRWKRPSMPVLAVTGVLCALVVSLALGWRGNQRYEPTPAGFLKFVSEFDAESMLVNLNLKDKDRQGGEFEEQASKETEEYGGFLLMMYAVPELSDYDYGQSYLRIFSTYIPRLVWPDKPLYGRDAWLNAWIAGSQEKRDRTFTGPAIGILGATQLNGGAAATAIVLSVLALGLRTGYDYFRFHCHTPWAQLWWAMTYYVAWLMTVNDDPMVWFYYIYGHTTLPPMAALWVYLKFLGGREPAWQPAIA